MQEVKSKLYLVSIHIGNPDDMTLRALQILKDTKHIVCEDYKIGKRMMNQYDLGEKNLMRLNVKSREDDITDILEESLMKGEDVALFSDTGTPVFADPGYRLLKRAYHLGVDIVPVPGASSIMAALVKSDIEMKRFYYYGFLSAKKEQRDVELKNLKHFRDPMVFLEAPYRLNPVLKAIKKNMGGERYINVVCELTTPEENIVRGPIKKVYEYFEKNPFKGEFVIILAGAKAKSRGRR